MKTRSCLPCIIAGAAGAIVATVLPAFIAPSKAETKLLPFQGRLTDAAGNAVGDGARVVEFKMYDAPTGGNVKWAGEVHKLSINGGLVNTMLGSKASLGSVDFSTPTYLQITVDASGNDSIGAEDPPLLPRQSVVPSVYAAVAGEIQYGTGASFASVKGSDILNSAGKIKAPAIAADDAITASQLGTDSVDTAEIKNGSVTLDKLHQEAKDALGGPGSIDSLKIKDGEVKLIDIAVNSVDGSRVVDGTITATDLADGAITPEKQSPECAVFYEEYGPTTDKGAAQAGWQLRPLTGGAIFGTSISRTGNTITLQPGTYSVVADAVSFATRSHQVVLRDVTAGNSGPPTNSTSVIRGISTWSYESPAYATGTSSLRGLVTVSGSSSKYELWSYVSLASPQYGFGISTGGQVGPGSNVNNRYAQVSIVRLN